MVWCGMPTRPHLCGRENRDSLRKRGEGESEDDSGEAANILGGWLGELPKNVVPPYKKEATMESSKSHLLAHRLEE